MLRQRLRSRTSAFGLVGRMLVLVLACALVFYGAILLLLALKVAPGTLDSISGYRSAYDALADTTAAELSDTLRIVAAVAGVVAFLVFGYLALKQLPRPYLARHDLQLADEPRGTVTVQPRAIERVAEAAAGQHQGVAGATGRYGADALTVGITVRQARDVAGTLRDVQASVAQALEQHGLPVVPVHLTLTGFDRRTQRELS